MLYIDTLTYLSISLTGPGDESNPLLPGDQSRERLERPGLSGFRSWLIHIMYPSSDRGIVGG